MPQTTPPAQSADAQTVAAYYNRNTRLFLRLGGSGEAVAAIHRQVWAPGVSSRRGSFEYLNQRVADALRPSPGQPARLLDLGCGIGGTSTWVASRLGSEVVGVTLSEAQVQQANQRAAALKVAQNCRFVAADFHHLPELSVFDGAWAIESFSHSNDPDRFFQQAAQVLKPGGRLAIADDFLAQNVPPGQAQRWVETYRSGWKLANLDTTQSAQTRAEKAGLRLVAAENLSPYLRFVPAWLLCPAAGFLSLPIRSLFWESLRGSTALQVCGQRGWTEYHWLVWEKES